MGVRRAPREGQRQQKGGVGGPEGGGIGGAEPGLDRGLRGRPWAGALPRQGALKGVVREGCQPLGRGLV